MASSVQGVPLAAVGLLKGWRAGRHWQTRDLLTQFGAIPSADRFTVDGRFYTSGGVTSGVNVVLRVVADLEGETVARKVQLAIEYDPHPPFPGGRPDASPPAIVMAVLEDSYGRHAERKKTVADAAGR